MNNGSFFVKNVMTYFPLDDSDEMSELDGDVIITYVNNVWQLCEQSKIP